MNETTQYLRLDSVEAYLDAHKYTYANELELKTPQTCVCIYCQTTFDSMEIQDYTNDYPGTALCPYCGIDTVIGEYSGYHLDDTFKQDMYDYFFSKEDSISNHVKHLGLFHKPDRTKH